MVVVAPLDVVEDVVADPVGVVGVDGVDGVVDPEDDDDPEDDGDDDPDGVDDGVVDPEDDDDPDGVLGSVELVGVGVGVGVVGVLEADGVSGVTTGTVILSELSEPTLTLLPVPEMWTLVMGALMLTFWNCMPMSPKPPSFPTVWLWLPSTPKMSSPDPLARGPATLSLAGTAGVTGTTGTTGTTGAAATAAAGCGLGH